MTGTLYIIVSTGISLALPPREIAASGAPFALFVEYYWGRSAGLTIAAFAAIAAIGAMNGWVLLQGEVLLGMARADLIPRWIGHTDARDVPGAAAARLQPARRPARAQQHHPRARRAARLHPAHDHRVDAVALYRGLLRCPGVAREPILAVIGLLFSFWVMWGAGLEAIGLSLILTLTAIPLYWLRARPMATAQ